MARGGTGAEPGHGAGGTSISGTDAAGEATPAAPLTGSTGATDPAGGPRSRLLPGTRSVEAGEVVRSARVEHGPLWSALTLGTTVLAGAVGVLVTALAVRLGGEGRTAAGPLTWLGVGVGVGPALVVALTRDATSAARRAALATAALVTAAPVGLRVAAGPATPDDLLRYAQLAALRAGGPLFTDRFPAVVGDQPGLPALTAAVGRVSGLTVWHSAVVVLLVAHVVAVVGVRAVVRALGFGERVGALAAVLWSLGPAVLVATSRVSGTTLALALLIWALAAVVQAANAAGAARRVAWTVTGVGLAAAVVVTDLPTGWALVGLTLLVGLATAGVTAPPVAGATVRRAWWPAAVGVLVVTAAWSLLPAGRAVLGDLGGLGAGYARSWSVGPVEVTLAVVAVVVALGLAGLGVRRSRARLGEVGPRFALGVGALFPVSLLGLLGSPGATLTTVVWPVLAVGLAPFVAAGGLVVWDLSARRTRSARPDRSVAASLRDAQRDTRTAGPDRRVPLPAAATAAVVALGLVGLGAGAATTPSAAEPVGPSVASGTVSTTALLAVADRLAALAGPDGRFAASDPAFGDVLAAVTGATAVRLPADLPVFDDTPTGRTQAALAAAGVGWLVDTDGREQAAFALTPWLVRVVATSTVTVYRVRPAVPGATADDGPAGDGVVGVGAS